jgi:DNA/RNA endonuclease YhcR with UshA esterase domain
MYAADNGGYATGIARHSADGRQWGDVKGAAKLTNTGAVVGPANLRYSSEADEDGYVYLIGRDKKEIYRYHTDTLNVALIDSGGYTTNLEGLAVADIGDGKKLIAVAGQAKVYLFELPASGEHFGAKTLALDGDSTVIFWDVTFGRDSTIFATFYGAKDDLPPGVAKFDFHGYSGSPLKLADAVWTATVDSGRGNTCAYFRGTDTTGTDDLLYFTIARRRSGDLTAPQNIYVVSNLNDATPALDTAYVDKQNNMSQSRSDITVDAVGNVIYFENSNEEVVLISPPTGPNSFTLQAIPRFNVFNQEAIVAVRRNTVDYYKPDRVNDTVNVIGTVISINPTASANRFAYYIQDETGGIYITKGSVTGGGPVYAIGDRLLARGVVAQFRGTTQLNINDLATDITLIDSNNVVVPITLRIDQYLADPETYEGRFLKINGIAKTAASVPWPAAGDANMTIWDGATELLLRIDGDTDIDGQAEPATPWNVQGVATQYTSASTVYNDGYQLSPNTYTDFTAGVQAPPSRVFALLSPTHASRIVLNDTAQTVTFLWHGAVDLNGDQVIYQWIPVGFSAVPTGNAAKDTFLVRTGKQLLTYLAAQDSVVLRWTVAAKDPTNPPVGCKDTLTVTLVRGTITGVAGLPEIPTAFELQQNYPNPFNPSTTIRFALPSQAMVTLRVYDALGREIHTLLDEQRGAGYYEVQWQGTTAGGSRVASGVYFYRLTATPVDGGTMRVDLKKMVLVK